MNKFQYDVQKRAMEKLAGIGDTLWAIGKSQLPILGGAIAGGLGGYLGHKVHNLDADAYQDIDPAFAEKLRPNEASTAQAVAQGALMGAMSGAMGNAVSNPQTMLGSLGIGAALGALPGLGTGLISMNPAEVAQRQADIEHGQELDDQILQQLATGQLPGQDKVGAYLEREKVAGIGDYISKAGLISGLGGAITGGIAGYLGHRTNDGLSNMLGDNPELADELRSSDKSRLTAGIRGALIGGMAGAMPGGGHIGYDLARGAIAGLGPGLFTGMWTPSGKFDAANEAQTKAISDAMVSKL